ncbi:MAG: sulfatase-like hydrolase/transferase [Gammaproteobacteria bacterium]|nr:sulfatase-like hydrolase/transferase [Gammaproteobacteria bacterium]
MSYYIQDPHRLIRFSGLILILCWVILVSYWYDDFYQNFLNLRSVFWVLSLGYYGLLFLAINIIFFPLLLIKSFRPIYLSLNVGAPFVLVLDRVIYEKYMFHINPVMIDLVIADFAGMGLPIIVYLFLSVIALVLGGVLYFLWFLSSRFTSSVVYYWVLGLVFLFSLFYYLVSSWAYEFNRSDVIGQVNRLPFYTEVTDEVIAKKLNAYWPSVFSAESMGESGLSMALGGKFDYPKSDVNCEFQSDKNILLIVVDSWQAFTLDPEVTPNLYKFANERGQIFRNHYSSGSVTVTGLFGLMTGLHGSYYELFRSNNHRSEFYAAIKGTGFVQNILTTNDMSRFSLRSILFDDIDEGYYFNESDSEVVSQYLGKLKIRQQSYSGYFDMIFLSSPHSPYKYPDEFSKFRPLPKIKGGYAVDSDADRAPYYNDYKNSIFYVDDLIGKMLSAISLKDGLENTWIVITGDHAEEFNENELGYWGHGSNFTLWQTQVPFVFYVPGMESGEFFERSTHQDLAPTLMSRALGCSSSFDQYANGYDLFNLPADRDLIFTSYFDKAYLIGDSVYESVAGRRYKIDDLDGLAQPLDVVRLRNLIAEESRFLGMH